MTPCCGHISFTNWARLGKRSCFIADALFLQHDSDIHYIHPNAAGYLVKAEHHIFLFYEVLKFPV